MSGSFIDSNVLIYLASGVSEKAQVAEEILATPRSVISPQVVNECASILRRKFAHDWAAITAFIDHVIRVTSMTPMTLDTSKRGFALAARYGFSVWDSMVVAAALEAEADVLWTEDLHDGLVVEGRLRLINPFARLQR
jgi:predicted nucleic acid-binding protein